MRVRLTSAALTILLAAGLGCLLAGCAGMASQRDAFRSSVYGYADGVRWKNYKAASLYIPAERRVEWLKDKESDREAVDVVDFEIRDVKPTGDGEATVDVDFSWRAVDDPVVKSARLRQSWKRIEKVWYVLKQEELKKEPIKTRKSIDIF